MRMPNGYGGISKICGNRRKPWRVRVTAGFVYVDKKTNKEVADIGKRDINDFRIKQKYNIIGYFATRQEAIKALASYNDDPYDLRKKDVTFEEIYKKWSSDFFPTVSESNIKGVKASHKIFESIYDVPMQDITLDHLQACIDQSGKYEPTLKKAKVMLSKMFKFAAAHEIINSDKLNILPALNIKKGNPNKTTHKKFASAEISKLWQQKDNTICKIVLMMIYSGVRVSELLELPKSNVYLDKHCFYIDHGKTESAVRYVPIADKVYNLFEWWMSQNPDKDFLITGMTSGDSISYKTFRENYFDSLMDGLLMSHLPHDTRYTTITLLTQAGVDPRIIRQIVGHSGKGVTEKVYTQLDMDLKLEAINKI